MSARDQIMTCQGHEELDPNFRITWLVKHGFTEFLMMAVASCPWMLLVVLCTSVLIISVVDSSCDSSFCYNGHVNETWIDTENKTERTCQCFPGWHGDSCQYCGGKLRCRMIFQSRTNSDICVNCAPIAWSRPD